MDYLVQVTAKAEVIADVYVTANTLTFAADAALEMAQHDEVDWRYHGDSEDHEVFDVLVSPGVANWNCLYLIAGRWRYAIWLATTAQL